MKTIQDERGFILVVALLIMVVLSIIGITATRTAFFEADIAQNDRVQRKALYQAEGGATLTTNIIEESINCPVGFAQTSTITDPYAETSTNINIADIEGTIRIYSRGGANGLALYIKDYPSINNSCVVTEDPTIDYPIAQIGGQEVTSMWSGGGAKLLPGGSLQMAAGYEGKGKSAAGGGTQRDYTLIARHEGLRNAESMVILGWRHVVGTETNECNYD